MTGRSFQVNTGIGAVDQPVNAYLGDHYYEDLTVSAGGEYHIMNILGSIWIAGVIIMLLYSAVSYCRLYRITRPRIYLPSGMERERTEYVAAHERAHLKRRDHWWKPAG